MPDHNDCAIPWHFIDAPHKFRVHNIISDEPLDFINPTSAVMRFYAAPSHWIYAPFSRRTWSLCPIILCYRPLALGRCSR
jgi:hypothetical protein